MIWVILISLLIIFFLWLLLVPVVIYTNTENNRYLVTLPGIFRAIAVPDGGLFHIRGWILFIPFRFNPFKPGRMKEKPKEKARQKKKKAFKRFAQPRMMKGALRAIRIKKLEANMDTDNFSWNAWLVPVFSAVNGENIHLQVNFEGQQSLLLDLRVTLGTLIWNIFTSKYKPVTNH